MTSHNSAQALLQRALGLLGMTETAAVSPSVLLPFPERALPWSAGRLSGPMFPAPLALRGGPGPGKGSVRQIGRGRSSSGHPRVPGSGLPLPWAFLWWLSPHQQRRDKRPAAGVLRSGGACSAVCVARAQLIAELFPTVAVSHGGCPSSHPQQQRKVPVCPHLHPCWYIPAPVSP